VRTLRERRRRPSVSNRRDLAMKTLAAIRFLLELAVIAGLAVAGARWSWLIAVLAPIVLVAIWSALVAPKARHRLSDPLRLGLEILLFAVAGTVIALAGYVIGGVVISVSSAVVAVALRVTGDPWEPDERER
jgi:Protein of unknown function (DUF2568)